MSKFKKLKAFFVRALRLSVPLLCCIPLVSSASQNFPVSPKILVDWSMATPKNPDFPNASCNVLTRGPEKSETYYCQSVTQARILKITKSGRVSQFVDLAAIFQQLGVPAEFTSLGGPLRWSEDKQYLYVTVSLVNLAPVNGNPPFSMIEPNSGVWIFDQSGNLINIISVTTMPVGIASRDFNNWLIPTGLVIADKDVPGVHTKGTIYVGDCKTARITKLVPDGAINGSYTSSVIRELGPFEGVKDQAFSFDWSHLGIFNQVTGINSMQLSQDNLSIFTVATDEGTGLKVDLTKQSPGDLQEVTTFLDFDTVTLEGILVNEEDKIAYLIAANEAGSAPGAKLSGKVFAVDISDLNSIIRDDGTSSNKVTLMVDESDNTGEQEEAIFSDNGKKILYTTIDVRCFFPPGAIVDSDPTIPPCAGGTIKKIKSKVDFDSGDSEDSSS